MLPALLLVLVTPAVALVGGLRLLFALALPLGLLALLSGPPAPALSALALGLAWGLFLAALRRSWPPAWLAGMWLLLVLLPLWVPPVAGALQPGASPPALTWFLWPAAPLAGPTWDPARIPPLYGDWGSRTPLPAVPAWPPALLLGLAAGLLYWRRRSREGSRRPPESRA